MSHGVRIYGRHLLPNVVVIHRAYTAVRTLFVCYFRRVDSLLFYLVEAHLIYFPVFTLVI